jgi:CubicO group peptidase (beta-lactamase class C family)
MTATAIMLLTDRFSVDDPVVKVHPEFKMTDPRYTKITGRSSS